MRACGCRTTSNKLQDTARAESVLLPLQCGSYSACRHGSRNFSDDSSFCDMRKIRPCVSKPQAWHVVSASQLRSLTPTNTGDVQCCSWMWLDIFNTRSVMKKSAISVEMAGSSSNLAMNSRRFMLRQSKRLLLPPHMLLPLSISG